MASESTPVPPGTDPVAANRPTADSPKAAQTQTPAEATPAKTAATGPAPETNPGQPSPRNIPALATAGGATSQPGPPGAPTSPAPAAGPAADPKAAVAENPFAVFSETTATAPAGGTATAAKPGAASPAPDGAPADANPPAATDPDAGPLGYLTIAMANRGSIKNYKNPMLGAKSFMDALKAKDLAKVAEATALRAPQEATGKNQKLFAAILKQELSQEDLDELARRLNGFTLSGNNQPKSTAMIGLTFSKRKGTSILMRTITMRLEKAGWKVVDIGGEKELKNPVMMPGGGRMGRRR